MVNFPYYTMNYSESHYESHGEVLDDPLVIHIWQWYAACEDELGISTHLGLIFTSRNHNKYYILYKLSYELQKQMLWTL